jgi:hypothetical protein
MSRCHDQNIPDDDFLAKTSAQRVMAPIAADRRLAPVPSGTTSPCLGQQFRADAIQGRYDLVDWLKQERVASGVARHGPNLPGFLAEYKLWLDESGMS